MRIEEIKSGEFKSTSGTNSGRRRPLALVILDGWGYSPHCEGNAIALAHTPYYDKICQKYPKTLLAASGQRVGLTADSVGNSEVGHLNIGAGRIVKTNLSKIFDAIKSGTFFENKVLRAAFASARENNSAVHLVGLLSDGEVHSSLETLFALLRMAKREGLRDVFVHGILDGRDVMPRTADVFTEVVEIKMADIGVGRLATLCGRSYAMDRNNNWSHTERAVKMLTLARGERTTDAVRTIRNSFLQGISDEMIEPIIINDERGNPVATVKDGDLVIFFNHRADRIRQLVKALAVNDKSATSPFVKPKIKAVCLTKYDRGFHLPVAFMPDEQRNVLAQVFAENGILNSRVTESEKYAHLTYFFNGGVEYEHPCEQRIIVPSLKLSDLEKSPRTSVFKVTDKLLRGLEAGENDVFIVNLAAADLLAHTGSLDKTVEAVQYIDTCLGGILDYVRKFGGTAILTADHGNCEEMRISATGKTNNSHTTNPVPFHLIDDRASEVWLRNDGALEDIAPTILGILGLKKPAEMTGSDLRILDYKTF